MSRPVSTHRSKAEHVDPEQFGRVDVDADLQEEDGDEEMTDRRQFALDASGTWAATEREASNECADDRREFDERGQLRDPEREREGKSEQCGA